MDHRDRGLMICKRCGTLVEEEMAGECCGPDGVRAYEVAWAPGQGQKVEGFKEAVALARGKAKTAAYGTVVTIWTMAGVVIGVITDDANGLTFHRLAGCPEDEVPDDE